jgi:Flp pilus assembly protein TadD
MEYLRALELNPNYAEGHHGYAALLSRMGRAPEARKHIRRAQELNPLSLAICLGAGWILCVAQDFQAAVEQCWKLLAMDPAFAPAQCTLGLAYQCLGMLDEATTELENACSCSGNNPAMAASLAYAYAAGGRPDDAKAILRELEAISERRYVSAYWTSMVWTGLGVHDRALDELEKACEHRDVWLAWLSTDPRFHPIRRDPRFSRVLQRSGLS